MNIYREQLIAHIQDKYHTSPEYPWVRFPRYGIFKHQDSGKMFALIADVREDRLGRDGEDYIDVLNLKLGDPLQVDFLIRQEGFFRGHPINRGNWISIALDGTVPFEEVCRWLQEGFLVTASRAVRQQLRPPKEWIIPANPKYFDIQAAFSRTDEIHWKQGSGIKAGDTVFMYVAAPVSAVLYKCLVTETDIPPRHKSGRVSMKALMKIRLQKRYPPDRFTFEILGKEYGIFAVRGPRGIPDSLSEALR